MRMIPRVPAALPLALDLALALSLGVSCSPIAVEELLPAADMRPPSLVAAGPLDQSRFALAFDEEVRATPDSFWLEEGGASLQAGSTEPAAPPRPARPENAEASAELTLVFDAALSPGLDYRLAGEVADARGNSTRLVLSFVGFNANPPRLLLSEVQTGKNSSTLNPHRDYVELLSLSAGDLGGVELSWISGTKVLSFRLPPCPVVAGDCLMVHLAPEGLPTEVDELGSDLALSQGADATAGARDLWCGAGGLADASGAVWIKPRPGDPPVDCLVYADVAKTGAVPDGRLKESLLELSGGELWKLAGAAPAYEDCVQWKPSGSRSLVRATAAIEVAAWQSSATGGQSPGQAATGLTPSP